MIILACLPIFLQGFNYIFAVFFLMLIFGFIYKLIRG